jgi:alanine racemase
VNYSPQQISSIIEADLFQGYEKSQITNVLIDSRSISYNKESLFFALVGPSNNGHNYIKDLIKKGVYNFVVSDELLIDQNANYYLVNDTLMAMQKLASYHRTQFTLPIVGVTGSNGKTIVKEWLATSLENSEKPVKTIGSYNSQVGVPLSVLQLNKSHTIGVFEAGISQTGEMEKLQQIIQPTIGVFTNAGAAHAFGFSSIEEKISEKIQLFRNCDIVICNEKWSEYFLNNKLFVWGSSNSADLKCLVFDGQLTLSMDEQNTSYSLPFTDDVFIENLMQVLAFHVYDSQKITGLQLVIDQVQPVAMRLEVKKGIHESLLIDDTYNNDPEGMKRALSFLSDQDNRLTRSAIISGYLSSQDDYVELNREFKLAKVETLYLIGKEISEAQFDVPTIKYDTVETFFKEIDTKRLLKNVILIKGARKYRFERIVELFEKEFHETILEVNLSALQYNLNYFRSKLSAHTKVMVMVKAHGYGAGATSIARLMQYNRVDYLGVAYVDEGVELRSNGIQTPIMVMSPTNKSIQKFLEYNLEPEVYSVTQLEQLVQVLNGKELTIHLKIDTGMHRLGFTALEIDLLISILRNNLNLVVASIFTHLAAADIPKEDVFTLSQIKSFQLISEQLKTELFIAPLCHVLNSAGIQRFATYQFDMVRLGIGLYGVGVDNNEQKQLQHIGVLKSKVIQVKNIPKGETIGYSRKGKFHSDTKIATIAIGYADGYDRRFSDGVGVVLINGHAAKVVGNVCMDMTMVDVSSIDAKEGDEVIIFSGDLTVSELAQSIQTIPYEILTNVSERVKRVFIRE